MVLQSRIRYGWPISGCMAFPPVDGGGRVVSERGQALIETMLVVPFVILLSMVLAEFGIYFYRTNLIEDTTNQMGRMAARGATLGTLNTYMNTRISSLTATLQVLNTASVAQTAWSSGNVLEVRVTANVRPVMPINALNIFTAGSTFFPSSFTLQSRKQVYVE